MGLHCGLPFILKFQILSTVRLWRNIRNIIHKAWEIQEVWDYTQRQSVYNLKLMWPWTSGRRMVRIFNVWRRGDTQQLSGHHPCQTVISLFYIGSFSCPWFLTAGRIVTKWFFFTFEIHKVQKNALHIMMMVKRTARIDFFF